MVLSRATGQSHSRHLKRAVIAATIGSSIEWYDFFLYSFAASMVLGPRYFPAADPATATLTAFGTYFGGFVTRPLGAVVGHLGDRIGRKATLVTTLLLVGAATVLIGLVPTYAEIGAWGGVILTVLRLIQGIGVGSEWGGGVLLAMEWAPRGRRGLLGSWPQFGVPVGLVLSYSVLQLSLGWLGVDSYWGWRVPFLVSALLIAVGLYIRLGVLETPTFTALLAQRRIARVPLAEAVRTSWREIALTCLIRTGQQAPLYIFTTFVLAYPRPRCTSPSARRSPTSWSPRCSRWSPCPASACCPTTSGGVDCTRSAPRR